MCASACGEKYCLQLHPDQITEVSRRFLLPLCVLPVLRYHLSQNDEASKYNDSTIDLHKLCQPPVSYLCISLLDWHSDREHLKDSFRFPVKFLFLARTSLQPLSGKILHDHRAPVIVTKLMFLTANYCGPLLSSHQTFRRVELKYRCACCKEPLLSWFLYILRNFGLLGNV